VDLLNRRSFMLFANGRDGLSVLRRHQTGSLAILAATLLVLGVILRSALPATLFVPWGRPFGSHYVRVGWLAFWVFLIAGLAVGLIVVVKLIMCKARRSSEGHI
jgi:hypothetical protein